MSYQTNDLEVEWTGMSIMDHLEAAEELTKSAIRAHLGNPTGTGLASSFMVEQAKMHVAFAQVMTLTPSISAMR